MLQRLDNAALDLRRMLSGRPGAAQLADLLEAVAALVEALPDLEAVPHEPGEDCPQCRIVRAALAVAEDLGVT
jgi:hypothetical protein